MLKRIIKETLLNEALKPSQFRKYVKAFNRKRYEDIFKNLGEKYEHDRNFYRIYIPLEVSTEKKETVSNTQKEVTDFLEQNGYEVLDYVKGVAKYKEAKNPSPIGRALQRLNNTQLLNKFVSDEKRKALTSDVEELMVVISRHPYDIAGADTDRDWTNCMTMAQSSGPRVDPLYAEFNSIYPKYLDAKPKSDEKKKLRSKLDTLKDQINARKEQGENVKYLIHDVKEGSLISYLIRKSDKNIQNPLAVLNIKPYINKSNKNDMLLVSDRSMYGNGRPEFKKTVDNVLYSVNGQKSHGIYCLKEKIYSDSGTETILNLPTEVLTSKIVDLFNDLSVKGPKELTQKDIQDIYEQVGTWDDEDDDDWDKYEYDEYPDVEYLNPENKEKYKSKSSNKTIDDKFNLASWKYYEYIPNKKDLPIILLFDDNVRKYLCVDKKFIEVVRTTATKSLKSNKELFGDISISSDIIENMILNAFTTKYGVDIEDIYYFTSRGKKMEKISNIVYDILDSEEAYEIGFERYYV